jgi:hypothetical protein
MIPRIGGKTRKELAGHQDIGTTQRSMHLSPAAIKRAIQLLAQPAPTSARGDIVETGIVASREESNLQPEIKSGKPRGTSSAPFGTNRGSQSRCRSAHFAWSRHTLATIRSVAAGNQPRRF